MTSAMIQKNGRRSIVTRHRAGSAATTPPRPAAISTTTNSANSITRVQLTGMNGVTSALDEAERDAAQQRARRIAEPAQHGHDEALELIGVARQHA